MSRQCVCQFSFGEAVGETPASYLQRWRVGLVQKWLKNGNAPADREERWLQQANRAVARLKRSADYSPLACLKQGAVVGAKSLDQIELDTASSLHLPPPQPSSTAHCAEHPRVTVQSPY